MGAMLNSLQAAGFTTIVCVAAASLAAYALARLEMRGKAILLGGALATQMVPGIVLVIPIFIIMRQLRLTDTILRPGDSLHDVSSAVRDLAAAELLPTGSESPRTGGSSGWMLLAVGALFRIVLPISAPGVAATAIFVFISSWNEFLFALVLTSQRATTVTIRLAQIQSTIFGGENFGNVGAAVMLMVLPVTPDRVIFNRLHRLRADGRRDPGMTAVSPPPTATRIASARSGEEDIAFATIGELRGLLRPSIGSPRSSWRASFSIASRRSARATTPWRR